MNRPPTPSLEYHWGHFVALQYQCSLNQTQVCHAPLNTRTWTPGPAWGQPYPWDSPWLWSILPILAHQVPTAQFLTIFLASSLTPPTPISTPRSTEGLHEHEHEHARLSCSFTLFSLTHSCNHLLQEDFRPFPEVPFPTKELTSLSVLLTPTAQGNHSSWNTLRHTCCRAFLL